MGRPNKSVKKNRNLGDLLLDPLDINDDIVDFGEDALENLGLLPEEPNEPGEDTIKEEIGQIQTDAEEIIQVMPTPDDERTKNDNLKRQAKKRSVSGRASTILSDADKLRPDRQGPSSPAPKKGSSYSPVGKGKSVFAAGDPVTSKSGNSGPKNPPRDPYYTGGLKDEEPTGWAPTPFQGGANRGVKRRAKKKGVNSVLREYK